MASLIDELPLKILLLYDPNSIHVSTLKEHLESFSRFSCNYVFYAAATQNAICSTNLSTFDVLIVHYSVRVNIPNHLSSSYSEALKKSSSFKVLFIQDEYDTTETARTWIEDIGIHAVFTCVPQEYIEAIYPTNRFKDVEFIQTLTGWVPAHLEKRIKSQSIYERKYEIGYRGRSLPYWYGNLGQEKLMIGKNMRLVCEQRGIKADIEWADEKRIYSEQWYDFLSNCKATLGTESGSNIFDEYGEIRKNIENALEGNPFISYEEIYDKYLAEYEGQIIMNQISPKIFEAIALKTALILFEGRYSGVIEPDIHYIVLKKDFSNIDEVLSKLKDNSYIKRITNRAYVDVIESGKYAYKKFINNFDNFLAIRIKKHQDISLLENFAIENYLSSLLIKLEQSQNQLEQSQNQLEQSQNQLEQSQNQLEQSQNRIKAIESSKFWKLRIKLLEVKKSFGLGNEVR